MGYRRCCTLVKFNNNLYYHFFMRKMRQFADYTVKTKNHSKIYYSSTSVTSEVEENEGFIRRNFQLEKLNSFRVTGIFILSKFDLKRFD